MLIPYSAVRGLYKIQNYDRELLILCYASVTEFTAPTNELSSLEMFSPMSSTDLPSKLGHWQ